MRNGPTGHDPRMTTGAALGQIVGARSRAAPPARPPRRYLDPMTRHGLLIAAILLLPACAGDGGSSSILGDDSFLGGNNSNPQQVVLPNQVSGGNRGGAAPGSREAIAAAQNQNTQLTQAQRAARLKRAEQLWCRANQLEKARNWSAAGDLYEKIVEDYPEYPQAAEAQFRAGKMSFERLA